MAVINNYANRKFVESEAILSYSFTNELQNKFVNLTEIVVQSVSLFHKGLKFNVMNNVQFNFAMKRINININPKNYMPVKKTVFHIEIKYHYKYDDTIRTFTEHVKYFPFIIAPSIQRNKCVAIDKTKIKKIVGNIDSAEQILIDFLDKASKNPNNVWRNKMFNPKNELQVIIKTTGIYINKKVLDKKFGKNKLAYIRRLVEDNVFEVFNNGKTANMVNVSNLQEKCLRTNAYKLTDVFADELQELGINFYKEV